MKKLLIAAALICISTPLCAEELLGTIDLDNRFVVVARDGKPIKLSDPIMRVKIESDLSGSFSITTTIKYKGRKYNETSSCYWVDNDMKTDALCTIDEDGGNYTAFNVVADWGELPGYTHGYVPPSPGTAFNRLFIKFKNTGFRIGEEDETSEGVGAEYTLSSKKDTLTLPVELKRKHNE